MNKVTLFLLLTLQIFSTSAIAKNACLGKQLKVVAIGDSITQGGNYPDEYSYRLPLSIMLKEAGYDIDFIGTQHTGLNESFKWPEGFDTDHEGFYGNPATYIAERLKVNLPKIASPDIAFIVLGASGLGYRNVFKPVLIPIHSIIVQLRNKNPKVRILISEFHLRGIRAWYLRLHLILFAKYMSTAESPVNSVPDYVEFTEDDTFDGMHPNLSGQEKMAKAWFKSINLICNN
jgi:acyl-CoA thioesterase-1